MKYDLRSRRMFLQGLGATALALPFLESIWPERVAAQSTPQARFVFMGHFYGRDLDFWYPAGEPTQTADGVRYADLTAIQGELSHALSSAFDPVRSKFSLIRGLDSMDFDNGHQWSQPLTASGTNPVPSFGYSLDAILEESAKFNRSLTKVGALRTSAGSSSNRTSFSFTSKSSYGQQIPPEWNPRSIYDRFFNATAIEMQRPSVMRKQTVTNRVMEDFRRLAGSSRIGAEDRRRLDNYMTLLSSVETRLGLNIPSCQATAPADLMTNEGVHSAMIDLEVAALACGLTNVVVHSIAQFSGDPTLGDEPHHAAAHQNEARRSTTEPGVSQHATFDRWVMTRVAEMLRDLDAVDDGGGKTLLDNTFFLYANAESRGFHTFYDMPVLVAGGQGKFNLGRYIDFRPYPHVLANRAQGLVAGRPYNNLLITFFKAMGLAEADYQKFGQVGFGSYRNFSSELRDHYAPFMTESQLNAPLPFLYKG